MEIRGPSRNPNPKKNLKKGLDRNGYGHVETQWFKGVHEVKIFELEMVFDRTYTETTALLCTLNLTAVELIDRA